MSYIIFLFVELKVQELIQQRRLLTAGLDAIMQSMQEIENLIAGNVEVAKPSGEYEI